MGELQNCLIRQLLLCPLSGITFYLADLGAIWGSIVGILACACARALLCSAGVVQ